MPCSSRIPHLPACLSSVVVVDPTGRPCGERVSAVYPSDDLKLRIQSATDLVELVGRFVSLKPKGREFVGLCPFHDDRTPSMNVVPHKQIFHCFSCGAGGDAFSFVMRHLRMSFPEALQYLGEQAGIEVPRFQPGSGGRSEGGSGESTSDRQALIDLHERVATWFEARLRDPQEGAAARAYLEQRGISEEMVREFRIGLAPQGWHHLCETAAQRKWHRNLLQKAGVVVLSEKTGQPHDRFRNRLMFPICDPSGRPIAFGGRKLDPEDEPKYLNSPEHPLFDKGSNLYGLHLARKALTQTETAVIVEGYTDVIACHQAGVRNVVATLGTALTIKHAKLLQRYVKTVILVFDGDVAGQKATDRALELFLNASLDVKIATLPDGQDPADLLASEGGVERWHQAMDASLDSLEALLVRLKSRLSEQDTVSGRQQVVEDMLRILAEGGLSRLTPVRRGLILDRVGLLVGLPASVISDRLGEMARIKARNAAYRTPRVDEDIDPLPTVAPARSWTRIEELPSFEARHAAHAQRMIVGSLLLAPDLFHELLPDGVAPFEAIGTEDMVPDAAKEAFAMMLRSLLDHQPPTVGRLVLELTAAQLDDVATMVIGWENEVFRMTDGGQIDQVRRIFVQSAEAIRRYREHQALEQVSSDETSLTDPAMMQERLEQIRRTRSAVKMPIVHH